MGKITAMTLGVYDRAERMEGRHRIVGDLRHSQYKRNVNNKRVRICPQSLTQLLEVRAAFQISAMW